MLHYFIFNLHIIEILIINVGYQININIKKDKTDNKLFI